MHPFLQFLKTASEWTQKRQIPAHIQYLLGVRFKDPKLLDNLIRQDFYKTDEFKNLARLGNETIRLVIYLKFVSTELAQHLKEDKSDARLSVALDKTGIVKFVSLQNPAKPLEEKEKAVLFEALTGAVLRDQDTQKALGFVERFLYPKTP